MYLLPDGLPITSGCSTRHTILRSLSKKKTHWILPLEKAGIAVIFPGACWKSRKPVRVDYLRSLKSSMPTELSHELEQMILGLQKKVKSVTQKSITGRFATVVSGKAPKYSVYCVQGFPFAACSGNTRRASLPENWKSMRWNPFQHDSTI